MTDEGWTFDKACGYVNMDHPVIASLLYDLDLMPEQIRSDDDRQKMTLIVLHLVAGEADRDVWKQRAESKLVNYKAVLKDCKGWMEAQFCPEDGSCANCLDGRRIAKEAGALIGEKP